MVELSITRMTCTSCAEHVESALTQVAGARSSAVSYPSGTARVTVDAGVATAASTEAVAEVDARACSYVTDSRILTLDNVHRATSPGEFQHPGFY